MKRWLFSLLLVLISIHVSSATPETYRVSVEKLNVREAPSETSRVIGTLPNDRRVFVKEITDDGWARIEWQERDAYVKAEYLNPGGRPFVDFPGGYVPYVPRHWLALSALFLSLLLYGCIRSSVESGVADWKAGVVLFLLLVCCEIYSILMLGGMCVWFCLPDQVGYFWMIVDFFLFGFVIVSQYTAYRVLLHNMSWDKLAERPIEWRWGLAAWPLFILLSLLLSHRSATILTGLFFVSQLFFLGWVFYRFMRRGLWSIGLLAVFFYLLGTFSILALAVLYLPMLIIFGIIMFLSLLLPKDVYIVYRI